MAIPKLRYSALFDLPGAEISISRKDAFGSDANESVGAFFDRDRALSIFADREARDTQRRCLLLEAAAIGEDKRGVFPEVKEFFVAPGSFLPSADCRGHSSP
jgi:hypothetical protein